MQGKIGFSEKKEVDGCDVGSFKLLCVTNRRNCNEDFFTRIQKIVSANSAGIILREKDLTEQEYEMLADRVMKICNDYGTNCILHSFVNVARKLECKKIHLPLPILRTMSPEDKEVFTMIGASCHSVEEALEAEKLGCNYIVVGHIFETDCKKGLPGRGVDFLRSVCESVSIPVYAIGGISKENIVEVRNVGAKGVCLMSGAMICEDVSKYFNEINSKIK